MAQAPYVPMGPRSPPASEADVSKMFAKLAKHARPEIAVTPKAKSALEWNPPVSTHATSGSAYIESVCGRFTVTKSPHELGWTYCAHDRITKTEQGGMATCLGCKATKEAAIELCEAAR